MNTKEIIIVIAIILLSPLILYLRDQTYRNLYGNATIREDIESLFRRFKRWRTKRKNNTRQ